MKNVHIIGTVGVPACYGGFETLVDNLIDTDEVSFTVYCSAKIYNSEQQLTSYKGAKLVYLPFNANGIASISYDILSMISAGIKKADCILILGVSGCLFLPFLRLFTKALIITNIDGLEWRRDKWSLPIKYFLKISEKTAVRHSDIVVSDNQAIAEYVKNEYSRDSKVIAYGGDHAICNGVAHDDKGYGLTVCRIEPENNISMILEAFSKIKESIIIVGNWEYSEYGRKIRQSYQMYENIKMLDPIYDKEKLAEMRSQCSFYIHGHSAGGTNPSLVEMMHFSKPILCFDCNYNRATTENKAIYFKDVNTLVAAIQEKEFYGVSNEVKEIANRRYTWSIIREQYLELLR
ncbi:Domain of uncharacterised function (DUF1972) [Pluralibacter gergoviae]|uniref:DUF1972 domain-containing protein n=1 Tax=Pluralibacter gergoviae TaxID=61647 RepID=UPI000907F844|nr:DUF1972 domain-containing protein [Pluralibacter gergoviae]SUB70571.1 Domain of uncharacterised function (DUF1972) [Pluralibacter gergoviae]